MYILTEGRTNSPKMAATYWGNFLACPLLVHVVNAVRLFSDTKTRSAMLLFS